MTPPPTDDLLAELPWLRRFAAGLVRSAADADDLVQDTLSTALAVDRPRGPLRGFLAGVARNLARSGRRQDARRGERERRHDADAPERHAVPADADAERLEVLRKLLDELARLPAAQRRAITARYMDGLEPVDIAARDGVSPGSVRSQLSRGLAALRERLDERSPHWLGCLGPWALGQGLVPPAAAPLALPEPATALPAASASKSLLLAALPALTVMKLAALLAIPALALFLLWPGATPGPQTGTITTAQQGTREELPPVPSPAAASGRESVPPAAPAAEPDPPAVEPAPGVTVAPETILSGTLADVLTGEPVPHADAAFTFLPGIEPFRCRSDAAGRFQVTLPTPPAGSNELRVYDSDGTVDGQRRIVRQSAIPFPIEGPVPVHVGPTFYVELPEEVLAHGGDVHARLRVPEDRVPGDDPIATLREGPRPWFRLPFEATELSGGAYELIIEDRAAMLAARVPVDRNRGIEPRTLVPRFERRGEVRFLMGTEGAHRAPALKFDLEPLGHSVPADVELRAIASEHHSDGGVRGTLRFLPPGPYRWSVVGAGTGTGGEVQVLPGESVEVLVGPEHLGATFDAEVLIDASAAPEAALERCLVMVTSEDEGGAGFMTRPDPVDGGAPGAFRIPLSSLAHGTWRVTIQAPPGVTVSPGSVLVTPGAPPAMMVASSGTDRARLELEVVAADGGTPLPHATATIVIVPSEALRFRHTTPDRAVLASDEVPARGPVGVFVRAAGFRSVLLEHDARTDPERRRVALEPGWSTRVLALDVMTMAPVAGAEVLVDGEPAGRTGSDGWCWIEGDRAPLRVDVKPKGGDLEVVGSPFEESGADPEDLDPPFGMIFQLAPRADR